MIAIIWFKNSRQKHKFGPFFSFNVILNDSFFSCYSLSTIIVLVSEHGLFCFYFLFNYSASLIIVTRVNLDSCCFFSYFWYCKHLQTHTDTHNCLCHFTIMMACVFESFFFLFVLMMIIQKERKKFKFHIFHSFFCSLSFDEII